MKKILVLAVALISTLSSFAQTNFTSVEDSDPQSQAILEELKKQYESYKSVEAQFTLNIQIPEEDLIVQKGTISQLGEKYHLSTEGQTIISDGKTLWYYVRNNNEVQINSVDPDEENEDMLSPQNFLKFYEKNAFICAPIISGRENNESVRWIELKPTDTDTEYFKLRLSIANKSTDLLRIKAFSKDGSRYTLELDKLSPNKTYSDTHFTFNKADYPNVRVEDLRLD